MRLTDKLQSRKPVLVVEFKPDDPNLLSSVEKVKPYVDAIRLTALKNASDPNQPTKTAEQICFESAISVIQKTGVDVVASLICRDHPHDDVDILSNLRRRGVDNLLALYGDPNDPPYPNRYEFKTSGELIRWVRKQEPKGDGRGFCIAVGSDPTSADLPKLIATMKEKREAGADLAITQPVFHSERVLESFEALEAVNENLPPLIGLLVPRSVKSIIFLEERLGVRIPPTVKLRVAAKGIEEGFQIVRDVYRALWEKAVGFYIYPWADPGLVVITSLLKELRDHSP
ncbi:MAG TPA: methylenetetrahydrofolate reductase [Candidatus Dormibacteraeota bacterium]|nr:methylenetetrahydrofolate reductase [Candidatus Dormibacteraeota bacterium]